MDTKQQNIAKAIHQKVSELESLIDQAAEENMEVSVDTYHYQVMGRQIGKLKLTCKVAEVFDETNLQQRTPTGS